MDKKRRRDPRSEEEIQKDTAEKARIRGMLDRVRDSVDLSKVSVRRNVTSDDGQSVEISADYSHEGRSGADYREYKMVALVLGLQTEIMVLGLAFGSGLLSSSEYEDRLNSAKSQYSILIQKGLVEGERKNNV